MRIALVTGASSGLGREFVLQIPKLYKSLDEIWVVARSTEKLKELEEISSVPVRIFDGDLSRDYIYERIDKDLKKYEPDIRMLVNCAGFGHMQMIDPQDEKKLLRMIDVNCRSLTKMTLRALPYLSKGSRVVQLASAAAFAPQPGTTVYAATKSYVYSFSRGLCKELKHRGICVTTVCPGPVETAFFDKAGVSGSTKTYLRVAPEDVVREALRDSAMGSEVSVYGLPMKAMRILSKFVPDTLIASLMYFINK